MANQAPEVDRHRVPVPAEGEQKPVALAHPGLENDPGAAAQLLDADPGVPHAVFKELQLLPELFSTAHGKPREIGL